MEVLLSSAVFMAPSLMRVGADAEELSGLGAEGHGDAPAEGDGVPDQIPKGC